MLVYSVGFTFHCRESNINVTYWVVTYPDVTYRMFQVIKFQEIFSKFTSLGSFYQDISFKHIFLWSFSFYISIFDFLFVCLR